MRRTNKVEKLYLWPTKQLLVLIFKASQYKYMASWQVRQTNLDILEHLILIHTSSQHSSSTCQNAQYLNTPLRCVKRKNSEVVGEAGRWRFVHVCKRMPLFINLLAADVPDFLFLLSEFR